MLFSGTSDLLSQIVKPLVNSSTDFSPLVNSFQRPSFLCTSSWLSSTLFSLFSSQLLSTRVGSSHLSSTCPIFSQPSRTDTVANFLAQASIRSCFQHSTVLSFSCHVLSFNPTGLLTVTCGSNVQARLGRSIFSTRAKICDVTSRHLSRAREQHSRTRLWVLLPERRNEQGHASSTAARATGMQRGVANAGSTAVRSSSLLLSARLSCKTQKNYTQRQHKLELQNRIPKPTHKNDLASTFWKKFL